MTDRSSDKTYDALRGDIVRGRLGPAARLRIDQLRARYGASVSTLRETLNRLASEGLVTAGDHRGFSVAPMTLEEFRELGEARLILEGHAMREAFARGGLDWEGRVVGAHHKLAVTERRMLEGDRTVADAWKGFDKEFHHALISACGLGELLALHGGVFDRYLRYQIVAVIFRGAPAAAEHRELVSCALERNAERAVAILGRHIRACIEHTAAEGALVVAPPPAPPRKRVVEETVAGTVWSRVRRDILTGRLRPGARLKLDGLRDAYGASVSTLRELLNRLATEGLVIAEGQRGFEVAPVSPDNLRDIAELRYLVEAHALQHSFSAGDLDWEARVVAAYHKLAASEERMREDDRSIVGDWKRFDWEFHQALIGACGSRVLMQVHGEVFDKYLRYQMLALSFRGEVAAAEHRALMEAALARDAGAAQRILRTHLMGGVEHALATGKIAGGTQRLARAHAPDGAD